MKLIVNEKANPGCAESLGSGKCYAEREAEDLGEYYVRHVMAMTAEGLHDKDDIAAELAWRDREIDRLRGLCQWAAGRLLDAGDPDGRARGMQKLYTPNTKLSHEERKEAMNKNKQARQSSELDSNDLLADPPLHCHDCGHVFDSDESEWTNINREVVSVDSDGCERSCPSCLSINIC